MLTNWPMLALASLLLAQPVCAKAVAPALESASQAFDEAQFLHDTAALDALLAPGMIFINGAGAFGGRAEFIATFANRDLVFDPFVITARQWVRLASDVATVTAEGTMTGTAKGVRFTNRFRFSDTFSWRNGRWQVVYVQVTRLPAL